MTLEPSKVQLFPGKFTFDFKYETCHGQLSFIYKNEIVDVVQLMIVFNDEKGNGSFEKLINEFEMYAIKHNISFEIVNFLEQRLCNWFEKRGYKIIEDEYDEKIAIYENRLDKNSG